MSSNRGPSTPGNPRRTLPQQHSSTYATTAAPMAVPGPSTAATGGRRRTELRLGELPVGKYHPSNYQSSSSSSGATSSAAARGRLDPRNPLSPSARNRQQMHNQLKRMQQEHIARAQLPMGPPPTSADTPRAPALNPVLSPGPATPLNLESNDYLSAGSGGGLSPDKVEEMIRKAREGSTGMGSNPASPAISPAARV